MRMVLPRRVLLGAMAPVYVHKKIGCSTLNIVWFRALSFWNLRIVCAGAYKRHGTGGFDRAVLLRFGVYHR